MTGNPHLIGLAKGCRRFIQDAKLNVDALFQNALKHKEHKSRFPYARDAAHGDGRSGIPISSSLSSLNAN
jgi:hypothetical protein